MLSRNDHLNSTLVHDSTHMQSNLLFNRLSYFPQLLQIIHFMVELI